jgi:hypothetical protein
MECYELEEKISSLLNLNEDLDLLIEALLDNKISNEEAVNFLIGLNVSIKLKQEKLFDTYKKVFKLDEYRIV